MNIAFLYIAEAYQCYHGAGIAHALAKRPGVTVDSFYNEPDSAGQLARIGAALGTPPMTCRPAASFLADARDAERLPPPRHVQEPRHAR